MTNIKSKNTSWVFGIIALISFYGCKDILKVQPDSQLSADNFLATENGVESVLFQAYAEMQRNGHSFTIQLHEDIVVTGRGDGELGAWEGSTIAPFRTWNWTSTFWPIVQHWNINYDIIYNTNVVLDNLDNTNFSEEFKNKMKGEALALRAYAYQSLYQLFGTVPIHTTTETKDLNKPRASEEEIRSRIEKDYLDAAALLPVDQSQYGRITKGGAWGMLTRFYLNTKQWQKAAEYAKKVMDLDKYELFSDYTTLFHIENEGNSEIIWAQLCNSATGLGNTLAGLTYPRDYPFEGSQGTFPARVHVPDWFVDSYHSNDTRADSTVLLRSYVNNTGNLVDGYPGNKTYPLKYGLDPSASGGASSGYDLPVLRYADILLMRAEALNELNGPNSESIALINQVRKRADIPELALSDFGSKDELRDAIFQERQWEFHFENITRIDMIRHGTFVSDARDRGISHADEHHRLYPIPQAELDANPNMKQNPGY